MLVNILLLWLFAIIFCLGAWWFLKRLQKGKVTRHRVQLQQQLSGLGFREDTINGFQSLGRSGRYFDSYIKRILPLGFSMITSDRLKVLIFFAETKGYFNSSNYSCKTCLFFEEKVLTNARFEISSMINRRYNEGQRYRSLSWRALEEFNAKYLVRSSSKIDDVLILNIQKDLLRYSSLNVELCPSGLLLYLDIEEASAIDFLSLLSLGNELLSLVEPFGRAK